MVDFIGYFSGTDKQGITGLGQRDAVGDTDESASHSTRLAGFKTGS
jgi:hypothetical protein